MYTMNQLTIIGFTGNDADADYTPNGTLVVTISVATKESLEEMPMATGRAEQIGTGLFLWQAGGVHSEQSLTKGSYVMLQGVVRTREYEREGAKHCIVEVPADTIGKLDRAERRAEAEGEA